MPSLSVKRRPDRHLSALKIRERGADTSSAAKAALVDPDKPLTPQQTDFVREWSKGNGIKTSATRAGYHSPEFGYRLASMPNVLKAYNKEKAKYEKASDMTRQKVMDGLLEAAEMAKLMSEPMTMVAAWREVGKMCGYYAPVETRIKVDVTGNIVMNRLNSLSDEELLRLISEADPAALPPPEESTDDL